MQVSSLFFCFTACLLSTVYCSADDGFGRASRVDSNRLPGGGVPVNKPQVDQCKPFAPGTSLRSSGQIIKEAQYQPDRANLKVFTGGYTDANKNHVNLEVKLQKNGNVELQSYSKKESELRFSQLGLQAVYNQKVASPDQGWYIDVHGNNACQHSSSLRLDQVIGFMIKYD